MIQLKEFLTEALTEDIKKLIKKAEDNPNSGAFSISKKELDGIMKGKKSMSLEEISGNSKLVNMISDKDHGFPVAAQLIKNPDKYFKDDPSLSPDCMLYFYSGSDNEYKNSLIGICMYDEKVQYIENLVHVVLIETSNDVENKKDINDFMLKDLSETEKDNGMSGMTAKFLNSKQKTTLVKLGFKQTKENKEIMFHKF